MHYWYIIKYVWLNILLNVSIIKFLGQCQINIIKIIWIRKFILENKRNSISYIYVPNIPF